MTVPLSDPVPSQNEQDAVRCLTPSAASPAGGGSRIAVEMRCGDCGEVMTWIPLSRRVTIPKSMVEHYLHCPHCRMGMGAEDYCVCGQPWPHKPMADCAVCGAAIRWQDCPTGGWWIHDVHPSDGHDAKAVRR